MKDVVEIIVNHQNNNNPLVEEDDDVLEENPFDPLQARNNSPRNIRHDTRWKTRFKVDLPEFTGCIREEEIIDWIFTVEEVLVFKQVPMDSRVALMAKKFRGRAASWWLQLKSTCAREGNKNCDMGQVEETPAKNISYLQFRSHHVHKITKSMPKK